MNTTVRDGDLTYSSQPVVQVCRDTLPHLTVHDVGAGLHFLPEDRPAEIGDALSSWLRARLDR